MYIPPIVNKFKYKPYGRLNTDEGRKYNTPSGNLPSVTTILSATSDKEWLENWRKWIGEQKANEITLEAATAGTFMHENLENRLIGKEDHLGTMPIRVLGRNMADVIQSNGWPDIDEVWGQEVNLFYTGLYAGTSDLVGSYKGIPSIMDYKNSRRDKTWDTIDDYKLQLAAYALAHNDMYGTDIRHGVIFVCSRADPKNLKYQEFILSGSDFDKAINDWIDRVHMYYDIINNQNGEK